MDKFATITAFAVHKQSWTAHFSAMVTQLKTTADVVPMHNAIAREIASVLPTKTIVVSAMKTPITMIQPAFRTVSAFGMALQYSMKIITAVQGTNSIVRVYAAVMPQPITTVIAAPMHSAIALACAVVMPPKMLEAAA